MFRKVEDVPERKVEPRYFGTKWAGRQPSNTLKGFTTWRCNNCRALAVGPLGCEPPNECGKCHSKGGPG
jgi:hypothetical protein